MAFPAALVEILFDDWTDVTADLRSFSFTCGRSRETDRTEAGVATIVLDNLDRDFEPGNKAGSHYPNVRPQCLVRVSALVDTNIQAFTVGSSFVGGPDSLGAGLRVIPLFTVAVESWLNDWPVNGKDAIATITASDTLKVLAAYKIVSEPVAAFAGDQIDLILDAVGWPAAARDIDHETIMPLTSVSAVGTTALAYILTLAASEGGVFFAGRDGTLVYRGPNHALGDPLDFGGITADLTYENVQLSADDVQLWNDITVQTAGANDAVALDARSVGRYHDQPFTLASVISGGDTYRAWRARQLLVAYSEPRQRISSLTHVRAQDDWASILDRDLGDLVNVSISPPGGGADIFQESRIERISIDSTRHTDWRLVWALSALPRRNLLTDDPIHGVSQTNADSSVNGWTAETNCTIARVTSPPNAVLTGAAALQLVATAGGDMSAVTTPNTQIPVIVGNRYVASAWFQPATGGVPHRNVRVDISWRDTGGSLVSNTTGAIVVENPTAFFTSAWVDGVAPPGAAFAIVRVAVIGASAAEKHDVNLILLTSDD